MTYIIIILVIAFILGQVVIPEAGAIVATLVMSLMAFVLVCAVLFIYFLLKTVTGL